MSLLASKPNDLLRRNYLRTNPNTVTINTAMGFSIGQRRRISQPNAIAVTIRNPSLATFEIGSLDGRTIKLGSNASVSIALEGGEPLYAKCLDEIAVLYIDTTRSTTGRLRASLQNITQVANTGTEVYFTRQECIIQSATDTPIFYGYDLNDFTLSYTYDPDTDSSLDFRGTVPDLPIKGTYFIAQDNNTQNIYRFNPKTGDEIDLGALDTVDDVEGLILAIDVPAFKGYAIRTNAAGDNFFLYDSEFTLIGSTSNFVNFPADGEQRCNVNTTHVFGIRPVPDDILYMDFASGTPNIYAVPSGFQNNTLAVGPLGVFVEADNSRANLLRVDFPSETETEIDFPTGTPDALFDRAADHAWLIDYGEDENQYAFYTASEEVAPTRNRFSTFYDLGAQIDANGTTLEFTDIIDGQPLPSVDTGVTVENSPFGYEPASGTVYFEDASNGYLARLVLQFDPTANV